MKLIAGEQILNRGSSGVSNIILTDRRLHFEGETYGQPTSTTFFLEDINSIEMAYKSNPILLTIGGILALTAIIAPGKPFLFIIAALLIGSYYYLRKNGAKFNAGTSSIFIHAERSNRKDLEDFVDAVQRAKAARMDLYL